MSEPFSPYDADRPLMLRCACGENHAPGEHDSVAASPQELSHSFMEASLVKALEDVPAINHAYAEKDGQPFRVIHKAVNLGIAVDVGGKEGSRVLLVPEVRERASFRFAE